MRRLIEYHTRRYFVDDDPEITDAEFDELVAELAALERDHPEVCDRRLSDPAGGRRASSLFAEVRHTTPMMSLDKTTSYEELLAWAKRMDRFISGVVAYTCELKIDGLAMSLLYEAGRLTRAATRGDGEVGEDVTANVVTIGDVPKQLEGRPPGLVEVRGEIFMPIPAFEELNRRQVEAGGAHVHQPSQRSGGILAPEGPQCHRRPRARFLGIPAGGGRGRPGVHSPYRDSRVDEVIGFPRQPAHRAGPRSRGSRPVLPEVAGVPSFPHI